MQRQRMVIPKRAPKETLGTHFGDVVFIKKSPSAAEEGHFSLSVVLAKLGGLQQTKNILYRCGLEHHLFSEALWGKFR